MVTSSASSDSAYDMRAANGRDSAGLDTAQVRETSLLVIGHCILDEHCDSVWQATAALEGASSSVCLDILRSDG